MTHIRPVSKIVRKEWPEVLKPTPFRTIPKDNAARSRCTDIIGLKSLDRNEPWVTDEFDTGNVRTMEMELWGRTEDHDFLGELQSEEDGDGSFEFAPVSARCVYGETEIFYYNALTGECRINESDETEAIRIALGRN